jgi:AraC family transcriptional regulator
VNVNIAATKHYYARLQRVLHHIEEHLEDGLSVETLSGIAAFSKYHFHRQFTGLFGIGVHQYVRLARLKRASYRLAFRDSPIVEIALDSGYEGRKPFRGPSSSASARCRAISGSSRNGSLGTQSFGPSVIRGSRI